jgi:hypothetical protein
LKTSVKIEVNRKKLAREFSASKARSSKNFLRWGMQSVRWREKVEGATQVESPTSVGPACRRKAGRYTLDVFQ